MKNFTFDGEAIEFHDGDTVAAALLRAEKKIMRRTRFDGEARSLFCGIGNCFDCILVIDGVANRRSCMTQARENMKVQTQEGSGA